MNYITATIAAMLLFVGGLFGYSQYSPNFSAAPSILKIQQGGTGTSTAPSYGQLLVGNSSGTYTLTATSSLGITGGSGASYFGNLSDVSTSSDATGDLYYLNASGLITNLGIGSAGEVLKVSGGLPSWGTDATGASAYEIATTTGLSVSQLAYFTQTGGRTTLGGVATTTLTASSPLSLSNAVVVLGSASSALTLDTSGTWSGNAGTASALAANGTNCSAGSYPLGVDASGAVESCTDATTEIDSAITTHASNAEAHQALVTLAGSLDYLTLSGQQITRGAIDLATDVTGTLPYTSGGTGTSTAAKYGDVLAFIGGGWIGTATSSLNITAAADGSTGDFQYNSSGTLTGASFFNYSSLNDTITYADYVNGATFQVGDGVSTSTILSDEITSTQIGFNDSDASNYLFLTTSSNLTANRTITLVPGDANRTLTISGNPTLNDWFDQSVKQAASPTFAGLTLSSPLSVGNGGTGATSFTSSQVLYGNGTGAIGSVATGTISAGTGISLSATFYGLLNSASIALDQAANLVWTGNLDFGGATGVEIPNGTAPTVDATGEIAWDTTSGQMKIYDGSANRVLSNGYLYPAFTYATSTAWTGTTTIPLGPAFIAETWSQVMCFTDTGTVAVQFTDGTNNMNSLTASTTVGTITLSANNTFTAAEKRYVNVGSPASTPTKISCTLRKAITAD